MKYAKGKQSRKSAHKTIERNIEQLREELAKAEKERGSNHQLIESIPLWLWDYGGWLSSSNSIYINLPWDMLKVKEAEEALDKAGWVKWHENEDSNKEQKRTYWRPKAEVGLGYSFTLSITINPKHEESKCVLVPLKVVKKDVVEAYDHICPDEHPELFKVDENGKLVYVGDNVFPALEVTE